MFSKNLINTKKFLK